MLLNTTEEQSVVLAQALKTAIKELDISLEELNQLAELDMSSAIETGIEPDSLAGHWAIMIIRCYMALFSLVGGDKDNMLHWMKTNNKYTGGIPAEQINSSEGMLRVTEYLEALNKSVN